MFPLTYAPSRTPPSSGTSIFPYCCELFGWTEGIFLSVLLHSVFRAGFTAVICSSDLGAGPVARSLAHCPEM